MRGTAAALLLLGAGLVLSGCPKPKPGERCYQGDPDFCSSDTLALSCIDGGYTSFVCPAGCAGEGLCNFADNGAGDPCPDFTSTAATPRCRNLETHQTLDCKTTLCRDAAGLFCDQGVLVEIPCRGPTGCISDPNPTTRTFECDFTRAAVGDPCLSSAEGTGTCSLDGKQVLICKGGVLEPLGSCADSCVIEDGRVGCQ